MADLLGQASVWLSGRRAAHMVTSVTYRRGAQSTSLNATVGKRTHSLPEASGVLVHLETRDYIVPASGLSAFGTPRAGDEVLESRADGTHVFQVVSPGGKPPYEFRDAARAELRIHTQFVRVDS